MTYSLDFRKRVLAIKTQKELTFAQTSERFAIPMRTLFRWQQRLEPCLTRNKPATKIDMAALAKDVYDNPDSYQWERAQKFGVSTTGMWFALKRLHVSYKKTLEHPKADPALRADFTEKIQRYQAAGKHLVYLDESGFASDMPRTHGYSTRGMRCYGKQDWHARGRVNAIGAMSGANQTLLTLALFETNIDSDVFFAWLTIDLLPKLPEDVVMIMDNASFHKRADIVQAIQAHGTVLEYLPPYSPDLNPIEHKWAQAKAMRRQHRCSVTELFSNYNL